MADEPIAPGEQTDRVPPASFLGFLSGLGTQTLMQLGAIPFPQTGRREQHLPLARFSVDLLRILREKTEGRRSAQEDQYLATMLADLEARLCRAESGEGPEPR